MIQWNPKYKMNDYMVSFQVYNKNNQYIQDRFLGLMDISLEKFTQSEAKSHRVHYFKTLNGDVVWDRANKIDNF